MKNWKGLSVSLIVGVISSVLAWRIQEDSIKTLAGLAIVCVLVVVIHLVYARFPRLFGVKWRFAATAVVVKDDQVLLIYHPYYRVWLPPGSRLRFQEYPEDAVKRAVLAETGYEVELDDQLHRTPTSVERDTWWLPGPVAVMREDQGHRGGIQSHYNFLYVCRVVQKTAQTSGTLDMNWYSQAELQALAQRGELYRHMYDLLADVIAPMEGSAGVA